MRRRLVKTASGTLLHNTSPAAIEELLVGEMREALGQWKDTVQIKVMLKVDDEDEGGNVNNAFGAIRLAIQNASLYVPFIIADKALLPFDTIRMGDQEVSYDYSKLQKLVGAIQNKMKNPEASSEDPFQTMEVAQYDDIQPNNGFLGTIMNIRDSHRARDIGSQAPWQGPEFRVVDDQRLMRNASEMDVMEGFQEVMEKIAETKVFTPEQMENYKRHAYKQAEEESQQEFEKTASTYTDGITLEEARLKREFIKLSQEKLFNIQQAASGNNVAFPTFDDGRFEFSMGRVYRKFESWLQGVKNYKPGTFNAVVIDSKGGYAVLEAGQPFMASTQKPRGFELQTTAAKGLKVDSLYALEKNVDTLLHPFKVVSDYNQSLHGDGMILMGKNEQGLQPNRLFLNSFACKETVSGKQSEGSGRSWGYNKHFVLLISKDEGITEPVHLTYKEVCQYIKQHVEDLDEIRRIKQMVRADFMIDTDDEDGGKIFVVVPENYSFFDLTRIITNYYTRPDGLFKEGPMSKTAAYNDQNKATLYVNRDRQPKNYTLKWQFAQNGEANGTTMTKLERRSAQNLSEAEARTLLNRLGFDYRTQEKFFEITSRNAREATFRLPSKKQASQAAVSDQANKKVEKKMSSLANSMLHSKNFMPLFEDSVAGSIANVLSATMPNTVNAAHKMSDTFSWKEAKEVALEMEKVATRLNGSNWHEVAALLNMKYQLDKVASIVSEGNYIHKGQEVFEKVASFTDVIEKKASQLIKFNQKQLTHTTSPIVSPSLVKEALHQLDGLYNYASHFKKKEFLRKQAGLFRESPLLKDTGAQISNVEKHLVKLHDQYETAHALLRSVMHEGLQSPAVQEASQKVEQAENELAEGVHVIQNLYKEQGAIKQKDATRNLAGASAVGVPGLAALSYANEDMKNQ